MKATKVTCSYENLQIRLRNRLLYLIIILIVGEDEHNSSTDDDEPSDSGDDTESTYETSSSSTEYNDTEPESSSDDESYPSEEPSEDDGDPSYEEEPLNGDELSLSEKLAKIAMKYNVVQMAQREYAQVIKETFGVRISIDSRSIMRTTRDSPDSQNFHHFGLEKGIINKLESGFKQDTNVIRLQVNVDGVSVYKKSRSKLQFWPILGRLVDCRDTMPFEISVYCGNSKPPDLDAYLRPFIDEAKHLEENGLLWRGRHYRFIIWAISCDAPARSFLKGIKGHSGKSACERCVQPGKKVCNKLIFIFFFSIF